MIMCVRMRVGIYGEVRGQCYTFSSVALYLVFLRQDLFLNLELMNSIGLEGSNYLYLTNTGTADVHDPAQHWDCSCAPPCTALRLQMCTTLHSFYLDAEDPISGLMLVHPASPTKSSFQPQLT